MFTLEHPVAMLRHPRAVAALVASLLSITHGVRAQQDGVIGIYQDTKGTTPCAVVPRGIGTTLYVIATLQGATSVGISGAEYRVEISNPAGYSWHSSSLGLDFDSDDPSNRSGVRLEFPCRPAQRKVILGTIKMFNRAGGPTTLSVKRRSPPSDVQYACPLLISCDAPAFSRLCLLPSSDDCAVQDPDVHSMDDSPSFVATINADVATVSSTRGIIERLDRQLGVPISFVQAARETTIAVHLSASVETILSRLDELDPLYQWRTIDGRQVVYPEGGLYDHEVVLPDSILVDEPRRKASRSYAQWLRDYLPGFESLQPPVVVSAGTPEPDDRQPRLTLSRRATVVKHLVELLGTDSTMVFTVTRWRTGEPQLNFHRVRLQ